MSKYRLYPFVEVEAVQWTGKNFSEVKKLAGKSLRPLYLQSRNTLKITSQNGRKFVVRISDYVLKRDSEIYVLDEAQFEKMFEPAD